jgi:hypothetical protein
MGKISSRALWGIILISAGIIFLMESLGFLFIGSIWPVFFGIAGVLFMLTFIRDTHHWWAVIPGLTLIGLAIMILMNNLAPQLAGNFNGSIFLGCIGLSFLTVFLVSRGHRWWAMIPGGVLLTLAAVTAISPFLSGDVESVVFMFGLALTFAVLFVLPLPGQRLRWALYPAVILAIIGVLTLAAATHLAAYIWPIVFIGLGLYLILKNMRTEQ